MKAVAVGSLLVALLGGAPAGATPLADASYQFLMAQSLAQEGAYQEALDAFATAVRLAPDEAVIRLEYAELLFRLARLESAAEQVREAQRLAPQDPDVLRLTGQIHLQLGDSQPGARDRALAALEALREIRPDDIESMVSLAQLYLSRDRFSDASELLGQLVDRRPGDRMLALMLTGSLRRGGRRAEAERRLEEFLRHDPEFLRARLTLAEMQAERGAPGTAVETLRAAGPRASEDREVLRLLAISLYQDGHGKEALPVVERLLEREPADRGSRYLRAVLLADQERFDEAEEVFEGLLEDDSDNLDVGLALVRLMEQAGRPAEASARLEELAAQLEESGRGNEAAEARSRLTQLYSRLGEWDRILELPWSAVEASASLEAAQLTLVRAEALEETGDDEEALAVLAAVADGTPLAPHARARQAEILYRLERTDAAEEQLRPLAQADEPEILMLAAGVYQGLQLYARSVPILEKVVAREPDSLQGLFWLGAAFERTGRYKDAEERFRQVLDLEPDFAPALNYLGYMWAEKGENLREALELVLRAVSLEPENGAYVDSLGWAYFQLGRYDEARGHLERAAELVPDDAIIYEHLGDLYLAVGDAEGARERYEQAVRLEGENHEKVREKLEQLTGSL